MIRDQEKLDTLLAEVHDWVRNVAHPAEDRVDADDEVPPDIVHDMAQRGFFGWSIPREYGGLGLTTEELVLGAMELSQMRSSLPRGGSVPTPASGPEALVADGTKEQKQLYLPRLASGEITGSLALTEPEAGSDASALTTSARRDGADYVLNGMKCYITNAPIADLFTVFARTDPDTPGAPRRLGLLGRTRDVRPQHLCGLQDDGPARLASGRGPFRQCSRAGRQPYRGG